MKMARCLCSFARPIVVLITIVVVTLAAVTTQTQSGRGKNPSPDSRQNGQSQRSEAQRIHRDAVRRLAKLIDEAQQIEDAAARARVMARLADTMWEHDEAHARDLFQKSYDDCRLIPTPSASEPSESDLTPRLTCGTVRSEIVRIVTARDPELAHRLVADIRQDNKCSFGPRDRNTSESARAMLLTQAALALVPKDPVTAASLGRQSLDDGIVYSIPELLRKLKVSDARLADDLTSAAITRIANDDINALELVTMGRYLFRDGASGPSGDKSADGGTDDAIAPAVRFLDAALAATNRFVKALERKDKAVAPDRDVFSEAAPVSERAASFFSALTELLPAFEQHHPTRLLSARALIERLGNWMDPIERDHMFVFYDNGDTPESLVAEAEASTEVKSRDELYFLAASLADLKGDTDKAFSIASKIGAPERRDETIDDLRDNQVIKAVSEAKYVEARGLASQIKKPEHRIREMWFISMRAAYAGRGAQIIPLLDETTDLLLQTSPSYSPEQADMLMEIARVYVKADLGRGKTAMKNAIDAINAAAGKPLDAATRRRFGRPVTPVDPLSLFGSDMSAFESLARADYFHSLRLAKSFNDRSLTIVAQLAVVRTALSTH
jgi:hypothetical protein